MVLTNPHSFWLHSGKQLAFHECFSYWIPCFTQKCHLTEVKSLEISTSFHHGQNAIYNTESKQTDGRTVIKISGTFLSSYPAHSYKYTHTYNTQHKYTQVPPCTFHKHISPYHPSLSLSGYIPPVQWDVQQEGIMSCASDAISCSPLSLKSCPEPCPYSQSKSHTYSHMAISFMFVQEVHVFETQYQQLTAS